MNTLKEKLSIASKINKICLDFAKQYFAEYAYLVKLKGNTKALPPSYYEDKVSVDYIDHEGNYVDLTLTYDVGCYGSYDEQHEHVRVPVYVLHEFLTAPVTTIINFASNNTEIYRKQLEQQQLENKRKQEEEQLRKREEEYRKYLEFKEKFESNQTIMQHLTQKSIINE